MKSPALAYRQFSVQGTTTLGLVVMLYDGAIAAMQRAMTAIDASNIEDKCSHLNRAQAIIRQLEGTLNFELGGQAAQALKQFYMHVRARMMQANIENSKEILSELVEQCSKVRDAWEQADRTTPPAPSPANPSAAPIAKSRPSCLEDSENSEAGHLRVSA